MSARALCVGIMLSTSRVRFLRGWVLTRLKKGKKRQNQGFEERDSEREKERKLREGASTNPPPQLASPFPIMSLLSVKQIDEHVEDFIETAVAKTKKKRKTHKELEVEEIHNEEEEGNKKKKKMEKHIQDRKKIEEEEKEMTRQESILFGSLYSGTTDFGEVPKSAADAGPALFFTDRSASQMIAVQEEDDELEIGDVEVEDKKPAWEDEEEKSVHINIANSKRLRKLRTAEDENSISVSDFSLRSRAEFVKINPVPKWAQLGLRNYDESDEDIGVVVDYADEGNERNDRILRTNEELVMKSSGKLFPGLLEYSRLVDANAEDPSNGPINSVQFHRNAQLLLAAGLDRKLRFFQIDGKRNTMIQKPIFLEDCPIRKASFLPDGSQVIASGRRKFFYSFDLVNAKFDRIGPLTGRDERSLETFEVSPDSRTIAFLGNEGYILLVSCKTKELIGTMKMNGTARSLAFTDDGKQLLSSGGDGHIYHWDLRTMTCFHKAVDEGCLTGSSLCTSPNGALFAAGSSSGIVNVYNQEEFLGGKRKPIKTIENLTTKVDFMKFNHDGQILAICSRMQKNSLKLVHIPSFSVFSNWPPPKTILHHPRCLDFSPGGGFMAMGNADGKVLLYKLHQYQHA